MTITSLLPENRTGTREASGEITAPLPLLAATAPGGARHRTVASRPAGSRGLLAFAVIVLAGALLVTGVVAYQLGVRAHSVAAPAVVAAAPPAPAAAPVLREGPALVDAAGAPVDAAVTVHVAAVYRALEDDALDGVRRSYSAAGSDDWLVVESELARESVRTKLLAALRTAPTHRGDQYRYRLAGHTLSFKEAGSLPAGLVIISGPWTSSRSEESSDSSTKSTASTREDAPSSSTGSRRGSSATAASGSRDECAAGSTSTPTEGYPCRDDATGIGVATDGTAGVHGLKPCPPGTVVPSDPDKPTRNPSTGAICGYVSGSSG